MTSQKKVIVLGAGMVGRVIAKDLSKSYQVSCVDISQEALDSAFKHSDVKGIVADLNVRSVIQELIEPFDLVIGAVPGFMGYRTLDLVIEAGKNCVDISFFPEDALSLHAKAQAKNVTVVVDMGVAPGMSNAILGYHFKRFRKVEKFHCMVGGLPRERSWPFQYKAPFSPIDVIEEYTRPARYIENSKEVVRPALTDSEYVEFAGVGTLESFNTDGLRTLAKTCPCPEMKEKTLRYPGHVQLVHALREIGFFSKEPVALKDGRKVVPLELTSALMFPLWKLKPDEREFTVMRVEIEGVNEQGSQTKVVYDLFDEYDAQTGFSSMSRTTGFACAAAATLILEEGYVAPGVNPPEYLAGEERNFKALLDYQKKRGVEYRVAHY